MRAVALLTLVAGCFNPDYTGSDFLCTGDQPGRCPSGFSCVGGHCVVPGTTPAIAIAAPTEGDQVEGTFNLAVEIQNFTINAAHENQAPVPGEGHWHWFADGEYQASVFTNSVAITIGDAPLLEPGNRRLKAELFNNDHTPLDPEVFAEVNVCASDGGPTICIVSPPPGEVVQGTSIPVMVEVLHFTLDTTVAEGHGHWNVWVNGTATGDHFFTTSGTAAIPAGSGDYTILVELVSNGDASLDPPRKASVTVTRQ
jgi:hypothetical protein